MDAWETLLANSNVSNVDAWGHLNNQAGGEPVEVILYGGVLEVSLEDSELTGTLESELSADLETTELSAELEA